MKKFERIIKESFPTLVVFQHVGSQNSSEMKYLLHDLKKKFKGKANIITADASFDGESKEKYKLVEYPTYIIFKQGEEVIRNSGKKKEAELEDMLTKAL